MYTGCSKKNIYIKNASLYISGHQGVEDSLRNPQLTKQVVTRLYSDDHNNEEQQKTGTS